MLGQPAAGLPSRREMRPATTSVRSFPAWLVGTEATSHECAFPKQRQELMPRTTLPALLLLALLPLGLRAADTEGLPIPPANEILRPLRLEHPRLLATSNDFVRLRAEVASDPLLKRWHGQLLEEGKKLLTQPPSRYEIPDGKRLLATSRRVLDRVQTLALLHRLDGDPRWPARAWTELETAAAFKDWNPSHFLDTAEMTAAFAFGYDWLHDVWSPEQKATLRQAMVEKGLKLGLPIVRARRGWAGASHNWNQVCNGGLGLGALVLADVEPELAGEFLSASLRSLQVAMREFGPDGAWVEGPGYWDYATTYNVGYLAALETALGTDFKLGTIPGFARTGLYPIYLAGPTGLSFNYADAGAGQTRAPQLFWLARRFDLPACAAYQEKAARPEPLDVVWGALRPANASYAGLGPDAYYRGSEVVTLRGAWGDTNATFVGFKAGRNGVNHGHLDLGTFVLEALGQRWLVDLGADDYNLPGFFGAQRWTYYRLRAEAHNTLVLNPGAGPDQAERAATRITRFVPGGDRAFALADLTPAYAAHAQKVERGVALLDRRRVLVQDEVRSAAPADLWWFVSTPATIRLSDDGRQARLTLHGQELTAELLAPAEGKFTVRPAAPLASSPNPPNQRVNRGISRLTVHLEGVTDTRVAVRFTPGSAPGAAPALRPLAEW